MLGVLPGESICIKDGARIIAVMRVVKPEQCQPSGKMILRAMPRLLMVTDHVASCADIFIIPGKV